MERDLSNLIKHYDLLIEDNNDPVLDSKELKEYMDNWDGEKFIELLNLKKDKDVLEIGVGTGRLAVRIVQKVYKFTGIDISPKTVFRASSHLNYENVSLICSDFNTYIFKDKYDVIYSSLTLMHIENKECFFNKVSTLLKDNGIFVFSIDKNQDSFIIYGEKKLKIFPSTETEIINIINKTNLQIVKKEEVPFAHIFVCRRKS